MFLPTARELRGKPIDLAVALCAATMASPIAWEHHYGAFFPAFAIAVPAALRARAWVLPLVGYELVANEYVRRQIVFADRWTGLIGSHIFLGALMLLVFLLVMRARGELSP